MTRNELLDLNRCAMRDSWPRLDANYTISELAQCIPYPFTDADTKVTTLAVATVFHVTHTSGSKNHTVVISCRGKNDFHVWCGDAFLESKPTADLENRIAAAIGLAPIGKRDFLSGQLRSTHGLAPKNSGCHFWPAWKGKRKLCKHTNTILHDFVYAAPHECLDELEQAYAELMDSATVGEVVENETKAMIEKLAFHVPILIEGDRGSGKTYQAFQFAKAQNLSPVVIQGHESLESIDLLGYFLPNTAHGGVWKDGRLSEAFRCAKSTKVVLVIDEMLRIPGRHLSVLLSALTPLDDFYCLNTGRILNVLDGIGTEEMLRCPTDNLCVIATTNVGGEYAVDALDPALAERFMVLREDTNSAKLKMVLEHAASGRGFGTNAVERLLVFFQKMTSLSEQGLVARLPTTRTLTRALALAPDESSVRFWVEQSLLSWVGRDVNGFPVKEQVSSIKKLIGAVWSTA